MSFKFKHAEKITGVFILLAVVILIVGAVVISVSKKTFVKTHVFKTLLSDAAGLSTSTPLSFKGYEIGRVKKFLLDKDNNIDVELGVYKEYREKTGLVPSTTLRMNRHSRQKKHVKSMESVSKYFNDALERMAFEQMSEKNKGKHQFNEEDLKGAKKYINDIVKILINS